MSISQHIRDLLPWSRHVPRSLLAPPRAGEVDTRPYYVWTEEEAASYYAQDETIQKAWQSYALSEARAFNERNSYDKQVCLYYQWTPEMRFSVWLAHRSRA